MSGSRGSDSRWWVRILAVGLGALLSVALVPVVEPGSPAAAIGQTASGLRTAAADSWVPRAGLVFNRPRGSQKMRAALIRRVIAGIKHAPPGSRLSFAMYSFDRRDVANALIKAHRRGVQVQLIIN
ncbi:MAG: phospholipase D-like domain-containing protein, partial [Nocardioides sp.]